MMVSFLIYFINYFIVSHIHIFLKDCSLRGRFECPKHHCHVVFPSADLLERHINTSHFKSPSKIHSTHNSTNNSNDDLNQNESNVLESMTETDIDSIMNDENEVYNKSNDQYDLILNQMILNQMVCFEVSLFFIIFFY